MVEGEMSFFAALFNRKTSEDMIYCEHRRWPRQDCSIDTQLLDPAGKMWVCRIVNTSEAGLGIATEAPLARGGYLNIVKPNIMAQVIWSKDKRAGLRPVAL
jgi:hypothetical protein